MKASSLLFKIANEPEEFDQIHRLNYKTFVNEIPQHKVNENQMLIDPFHNENTYVIAKRGFDVIGMIAVRGRRPFSLDKKVSDIDSYLPPGSSPCEIRLLAVEKEYRSSIVFYKLVEAAVTHCLKNGYNLALISGTVRQLKLYKKIGFVPFGPLVGEVSAQFQPMYLTKDRFERSTKAFQRLMVRHLPKRQVMNFLPGPVSVSKEVERAFSKQAESHRSNAFMKEMQEIREKLKSLTGAAHVQVLVGTGTLANDIIAAQLYKSGGKGLILANGEFGLRLADHARRMQLPYDLIEKDWNKVITIEEVKDHLLRNPDLKWLWTVHCETSTGYLFDIKELELLCRQHGVELCVDACSSAGVVPLDLTNVFLAAAVSGKAIGAYPGLAIVFHRESVEPHPALPRYLDLGAYQKSESVPYTHSSNLAAALLAALDALGSQELSRFTGKVRAFLQAGGLEVLGDVSYSPGIMTIALPQSVPSQGLGDELKKKRILLSYESDYLLHRNWVQVALMGEYEESEVMKAMSTFLEEYQRLKAGKVPVL